MPGSILGTSVRRVEDLDLLLGASTFVDNLAVGNPAVGNSAVGNPAVDGAAGIPSPDGVLHLAFVRSPMAHALLTAVDTGPAAAAPGVVAVFTAADLGLPAFHGLIAVNPQVRRPPLAVDRVRFVGEPVAVVVAESKAAAVDAAELVEVDYDPLPAVIDPEAALAADAPLQFPELGTNLVTGRRDDGPDPLADAEVVVRARMVNQRIAVVPMEGNAILVRPGPAPAGLPGGPDREQAARNGGAGPSVVDHDLTIWVSTQMPHGFRRLAAKVFELDPDRIRVIAPHVGGGFGAKTGMIAEHAVAVAAARALGRPVTWAETRTENLVAMGHGRGQIGYYELGLTRDGRITGLRARVVGDAGAYAGFGGLLAVGPTRTMCQGVYDVPALSYAAAGVVTNTTPVGAFRGAGRPEATAYLERLIDMAADELGLDPVEIRRRNFLDPAAFPLTTHTGARYDVGDYDLPLREALRLADYPALRAEQAARRAAGDPVQLGIGLSVYVEITAGGGGGEFGSVTVHADGSATVAAGTSAHGQGHATAFAMLVSDRLGIAFDRIRYVQSDTALVPRGGGTAGSRSLQTGGSAVAMAAEDVLEQARRRAAELLEAAPEDVELVELPSAGPAVTGNGTGPGYGLGVAGVPGAVLTWAQVAEAEELSADADFRQDGATFPFGAHLSVVEVDTATGRVTPIRHIAVDDCGRVLNPLLVQGQQHGGLAQGIAQALYEEILFDPDGQPLTASLADYRMPSAADLIDFETAGTETPTPLNPLGAKGIGESATVGATPAVQNAVVDALRPLGVRHVDLPCTPQRVWRAIRDAAAGRSADPWREPPEALATLPVPAAAPTAPSPVPSPAPEPAAPPARAGS